MATNLTQPLVSAIAAFDATIAYTFEFSVIGGSQVVGNKIIIQNSQTGAEVYNNTQNTYKFIHTLPANTLVNGLYYNITIQTIDLSGNLSESSIPVPFYCYSSPSLTINNIPISGTIENGTYTFQGVYSQSEGELLNSYQFTLYDSSKNILTQSDLIYYANDNSLAYQIIGMENNTTYYVEISGSTINDTLITSGLMSFNVQYIQPASFAICELENDCNNGYIQISSNVVAIDGTSNPTPPTYIDNEEVDLSENGSWVNWATGFNIKNDFTMRIWGRSFNDNEPIVLMNNNADSTSNPNKIELKWMIGTIMKNLPNYNNVTGTTITVNDSLVYPIKNLKISGNSIQVVEDEIALENGEFVSFETDPEKNIVVDTQGNTYQANLILPSTYTQLDYLQSTGTQYIDTGFKPNNNTSIEMEIYNSSTTDCFFYGARENVQVNAFSVVYLNSTSSVRFDYGNSQVLMSGTYNTTFTINQDKTKNYINNVSASDSTANTFSCPVNLYLGTVNLNGTASTSMLKGYIYYAKIWDNGVLIRNMIPCKRNSDNVLGMYDLVNNVFYTNAGTGTFIAGTTATLPNPNNSIAIQNVGDNINLFDGIFRQGTHVSTSITNGIISQNSITSINGNSYTISTNLPSTYKWKIQNQNTNDINNVIIYNDTNYSSNSSVTVNCTANGFLKILIGKTDNSDIILSEVLNYNFKLEEGTMATAYSVYNQGSISTVLSNSNLAQINIGNIWSLTNNNSIKNLRIAESSKIIEMQLKKGIIYKINYNAIVNPTASTSFTVYIDNVVNNNISFFNINNYTTGNIYTETFTAPDDCVLLIRCLGNSDASIFEFQMWINVNTVADYVEHEEQDIIIPTQAPMCKIGTVYDYFTKINGVWNEVHNIYKLTLNGTENWTYNTTGTLHRFINSTILQSNPALSSSLINFANSHFNKVVGNAGSTSATIPSIAIQDNRAGIIIAWSQYSSAIDFQNWLTAQYNAGTPVTLEYVLATPVYTPCTTEQTAILNQLQELPTYKGQNIIYSTDNISPIFNVNYPATPSLLRPSKIYESGDIKNLINVSNFNITYTQGYFDTMELNFIPQPNFIYSFGFDYTINNETTDIYYSIGYGLTGYDTDIVSSTQYNTQTTGRNAISFQIPSDIPTGAKLFIKFVRTPILADVNVDISNIQLEYGKIPTSYQSSVLYDVNLCIAGKNLYDYSNPIYSKLNNITSVNINNGYNISCINSGENSYLELGYKNMLVTGETYTLSYYDSGSFDKVEIYTTLKNSETTISKLTLTNGTFIAPSNTYDLKIVWYVDSTTAGNNMEIWNMQIEKGSTSTLYEPYNGSNSSLVLSDNLKGINNIQDMVCESTQNLLNPSNQEAIVNEMTSYYFSNNTGTSVTYNINFLNEENIIISSTTSTGGILTTPTNCSIIQFLNLTQSDIETNKMQIELGSVFSQYMPYITIPSIVRNLNKIILDGTENWELSGTDYFYLPFLELSIYPAQNGLIKSNYFTSGTTGVSISSTAIQIAYNAISSEATSVTNLKTWLGNMYNAGNPVTLTYQIGHYSETSLISSQLSVIQGLTTKTPTTNIYTKNNSESTLNLDYVNSITNQETQNNYVILRCYNSNNLPYIIHSNYIDIPKTTDKIFIWTRRKGNLFDLQIENLG